MENLEKTLKRLGSLEKGFRFSVEQELVSLRNLDKNIQVELYDEGFVVYSLGDCGLVVSTVHNGICVPKDVFLKQTSTERNKEIDLFTGDLYLPVFLECGGVWITSHVSRYFVDLNRPLETAVLSYGSSDKDGNLVNIKNKISIVKQARDFHTLFYSVASEHLLNSKFLFSGHSMNSEKDGKQRGDFCLIYKINQEGQQLKELLEQQGFVDVRINDPFQYMGGNFRVFADQFVSGNSVEFETNKRLYLDESNFLKSDNFAVVSKKISFAVNAYLNKYLRTKVRSISKN